MEISNKLILPILGVVGLIILGYFLTQIFGSFGQLNYQTIEHCLYKNERLLSLVEKGTAKNADEAWNASGRVTRTLTVDDAGKPCKLPGGGSSAGTTAVNYYTPNGQEYVLKVNVADGAALPANTFASVKPLAIMTANGGILRLIIQALPLIAALGILGAGYMWYKGGFGPSKVTN